jgi:hypothetical protein
VVCLRGRRQDWRVGLAAVGFVDIEITPTHEAAPGIHSAIAMARKPAT